MLIGDIVNYREFIGVVISTNPLELAINTGDTIKDVQVDEVVKLVSRKDILTIFESKVLEVGDVSR